MLLFKHVAVDDGGRRQPRKRVGEESPDSTGQGVPWQRGNGAATSASMESATENKPPARRKPTGKGEKVM